MVKLEHGNLLEADVEALVNTVNCVGVMGKGIALQFKQAFPNNFQQYVRACQIGEVQLGKMFIVPTGNLVNPKYIINFPTKQTWKARSRLEDIKSGLVDLIAEIQHFAIHSIAVPPLGCGNGGLNWNDVRPLIEAAFVPLPDVQVLLYEPTGSPAADSIKIATRKPVMTHARAVVIHLIEMYHYAENYRLSLLEIQKLAYFLQIAGEPLHLNFVKDQYGPYAENLNFLLQRMDGHFIRGYGDRTQQAEIFLQPGAREEADKFLSHAPDTLGHLQRVARLIEGFETPYGMELLATVHWVAQEYPDTAEDSNRIVNFVHDWSERKRLRLKQEHIIKAWQRLKAEQWLPAASNNFVSNRTA
jgi:O-acetyl-ADP-ribose deacetylase (regulator of RNase III)